MSASPAFERPTLESVLDQLDGVRAAGEYHMARCPGHDDANPSMRVAEDDDGLVDVHCFAGCDDEHLRQQLGLGIWMPGGARGTDVYEYTDAGGDHLYEVVKGYKPDGRKTFRQRRRVPNSRSGYRWSVKELTADQRDTPFMAPALAAAIAAGDVPWVCEGEKDVLTALAHGLTAACNAGGAGKFTARHAAHFRDADEVNVVQDKDDAGRKHGAEVVRLLSDAGVGKVNLYDVHPDLPGKSDLTDHFAAGYGLDDLVAVDPTTPATTGSNVTPMPSSPDRAAAIAARASHWTDPVVAERFARSIEGERLWCAAFGWMRWTGRLWETATDESVMKVVSRFCRAELTQAVKSNDDMGEAVKRLAKNKLAAVEALARGEVEHRADDFDADPDIAVAGNGVIDLKTKELLPHDPTRLVTRGTEVDYVPGATHADWEQALTAQPEEAVADLRVRLGQAFTGHPPDDDKIMLWRGGGENGKSTLLGGVMRGMGSYAKTVPDSVLVADMKSHPTDLMTLFGLRFAVIEETQEARRLDMQRIKKIFGTDELTARLMRKDFVTFTPIAAAAISSNFEVEIEEVDHGTWRRLLKYEFRTRYRKSYEPLEGPNDRRGDSRLRDRVKEGKAQQEAVLAWLVDGAAEWYANGCEMPEPCEQVQLDTLEWRKECDVWLRYAEDHLVIDQGCAVWQDDVLAAFNFWQKSQSGQPWGIKKLVARLKANAWMRDKGVSFSGQARRDPATVSRPVGSDLKLKTSVPSRPRCLVGVRFRTPADDAADLAASNSGSASGTTASTLSASSTANPPKSCVTPHRAMPTITDLDGEE